MDARPWPCMCVRHLGSTVLWSGAWGGYLSGREHGTLVTLVTPFWKGAHYSHCHISHVFRSPQLVPQSRLPLTDIHAVAARGGAATPAAAHPSPSKQQAAHARAAGAVGGTGSRPAWEVGVSLAYLLDFASALPPNVNSGEVSWAGTDVHSGNSQFFLRY